MNGLRDTPAPAESRDESFPRSARITRSTEFEFVLRKGVRVAGRFLVVHVLNTPGQTARIGFTLSKKVGKAVVRNRVRRRLREVFRRSLRPLFKERELGVDLIVRPLPQAAQLSQAELEADLRRALNRWEARGGSQRRPS